MYFSGVPRGDWPQVVDARPPTQPEEGAISISSESPSLVSEKVQGKRAAVDEPARKKRKTASAAPLKLGGISLGGDQTTRMWSTAMFEWSDDDEVPVAPPQSMKVPPRTARVEEQSRGGEGVPQQQVMGVPKQ